MADQENQYPLLKGNYKLPERTTPAPSPSETTNPINTAYEAAALVKLGGSVAFIKKSSTPWVWQGDKKHPTSPLIQSPPESTPTPSGPSA